MADGNDNGDFNGFACDCIVSQLYEALPGSPSYKIGIVPYLSTYDTQDQARHRGYWIPGVPVEARITDVKRDQKFGLHLINAYLYVIELEHGPFRWTVVKQNKDFAVLAARLLTHRAAERIRAPVRRAQEALDDALESIGIDIIPDHTDDCPYRKTTEDQKVHDLNRCDDLDNMRQSGTTEKEISVKQQPVLTDPTGTAAVPIPNVLPLTKENSLERKNVRLSEIKSHQLPSLGFVPDAVIDPNERRQRLEKWLRAVLHIPVNRNHHETAEFLEVSRFSFINELGGKYCEGFVKKRPGGGRVFIGWKQCCVRYCLRWSKRWLILKDSSVCYMNPRTEQIRFVLLFDRDFDVSAGSSETDGMPNGLVISNQQHILALKCRTPLDAIQWKEAILESMNGIGRIWLENHPYGSTFPVRRAQSVQWFVDGRSFMEHAANMMELAREEIFIAGWWLSPEIFMKRPPVEGNRWRLDEILKVLRHPDHYLSSGTFFWAHHEKLIVIDQLIAFVGGVDLCFGRWDDCRHKLADCGSVKISEQQNICAGGNFSVAKSVRQIVKAAGILSPIGLEEDEEVVKKTDGYDEINRSNNLVNQEIGNDKKTKTKIIQRRSTTFAKRKQHKKSQQNEGDIEAPRKLTEHGHVFLSVVKHTQTVIRKPKSTVEIPPIEMLNMSAERMDIHDAMDKYKAYVHSGKAEEAKHNAEKKSTPPPQRKILSKVAHSLKPSSAKKHWQKVKQETTRYDLRYMELRDQNEKIRAIEECMTGAGKLWVGKDYANFIHKDFVELDMPFHDFIDRNMTPRMPWHDIHACTYGSAARDIARHFIQRWNATKTEKSKELKEYPFLLPKCYDTIKVPRVIETYSNLADVQILRSVSKWSSLTNATEDSIQQAYLSLIANAQHYVYIENQFLFPLLIALMWETKFVKYFANESNVPIGDIGAPGGSALQAVLHWTYKSLSRGPDSLIESLKKFMPDPMEYIHIGSLRTYEILSGKLLTELIYIHCKLMIVDDRYVIIGSANINDRSQVGNRDSEVCILVKDCENVPSRMDGKPYNAGKFAFSLRKALMMEHLGLLPEQKRKPPKREIDVDDPVADSFFVGTWGAIAKKNTEIFEKVFNVIPTDKLRDFVEVQMHVAKIPLSETVPQVAEEYLRDLIGNLVEFPLNFLANANLAPGFASKEGIVPSSVFT
ncbi:phospholipase D [Loa loa]|uniref:Phospholipase n=1 Tax=Loa loa TaxID=7209 RepID=A0A1S0UFF2_LOALO|nr:phospholipase D [Loa loa]EJD74136.1 phospholipase D [Loa loa]